MEDKLQHNIFKFPHTKKMKVFQYLHLIFKKMERGEDLESIERYRDYTQLKFYSKEQTLLTKYLCNDFILSPNITLHINRQSSSEEKITLNYLEKPTVNEDKIKDLLKCYFINKNQGDITFEFKAKIDKTIERDLPFHKRRDKYLDLIKKIKKFETNILPNDYHHFILYLSNCVLDYTYFHTTVSSLIKDTIPNRLFKKPKLPKRESVKKVITIIKFMGENDISKQILQGFTVNVTHTVGAEYSSNGNRKFINKFYNHNSEKLVIIKCFGQVIFKERLDSLNRFLYINHPGLLLFSKYVEEFNKFIDFETNVQKNVLISFRKEE